MIFDYFKGRQNLKRIFLLIDSRRGVKENDVEVMNVLDEYGINYQITLTKSDAVKREEIAKILKHIESINKKHPALHPTILVTYNSSAIVGPSDPKNSSDTTGLTRLLVLISFCKYRIRPYKQSDAES